MDRRKHCAVNQMNLCSLKTGFRELEEQAPVAAMASLQDADVSYKRTLGNRGTGLGGSAQSFLFQLEYTCFTKLWSFLLHSIVNQP